MISCSSSFAADLQSQITRMLWHLPLSQLVYCLFNSGKLFLKKKFRYSSFDYFKFLKLISLSKLLQITFPALPPPGACYQRMALLAGNWHWLQLPAQMGLLWLLSNWYDFLNPHPKIWFSQIKLFEKCLMIHQSPCKAARTMLPYCTCNTQQLCFLICILSALVKLF